MNNEEVAEKVKELKFCIRDSSKIIRMQVPFIWEMIDKVFKEYLEEGEVISCNEP